MTYPTVIVNGVSVRVDSEGCYNLNDLHSAAVANGDATENQRPSQFMRSRQVRNFVDTLTRVQKCTAVKTINGGLNHGVWALELVAIRYAAWLSAEFEIRVYQTFQALMRKGFDAMSRLNRLDHVINTETKAISQCASQMAKWGVGGRKQLLHAVRNRMVDEVQLYLPGFGSKAIE
ncbi:KilA-N domain-containing protein [Citrobacter amalonaticus]|uniref:KilA-N domain-containing protein n=1 Tax=Citrobacter amalonaticus TaxID=35703 RepID=UPI00188C5D6C|nr:KilA-N domain-containing protein [Citrobacter amalonaticus]QPB30582.1 KilA-N domain-containing protein [Citrobacter amalonaticus]